MKSSEGEEGKGNQIVRERREISTEYIQRYSKNLHNKKEQVELALFLLKMNENV